MLHWKNKPIDRLSKAELQQALADSVETVLVTQSNTEEDESFTSFVLGILTGCVLAVIGIGIATAF